MTWIKICGMTNLQDALAAVEAGADAVGLVFYEKSPRCVTVETARAIVEKLPEEVEKVGVFVQGSGVDWVQVLRSVQLTAVQQHMLLDPDVRSQETRAVGRGVFRKPLKHYFALPMARLLDAGAEIEGLASDFEQLGNGAPGHPPVPEGVLDAVFLDSGSSTSPGGTGTAFDWAKAKPIAEAMQRGNLKLVVAGGLTPQNVGEAIQTLHPWGVDVVSGVEASPGKKDREKVRAFVRAVRELDGKAG